MSSEGEGKANRRGEPRVPFDGVVRLRYRLFQEFLEEHAANISTGGMFIRTVAPGDVGSELDFEVRLDDDFTLIQGRGEVIWVRAPGDEPGEDAGMGIRFVDLGAESQALVDKIVGERMAAGLELFDLESHAPAPPAADEQPSVRMPPAADASPIWELDAEGAAPGDTVGDAVAAEGLSEAPPEAESPAAQEPDLPEPQAPRKARSGVEAAPFEGVSRAAAAGRSSPARLLAVAVLSALVGAGAVLAFYWLFVQPSIDALETRIDELAGSPGGPWQPPSDEPDPAAAPAGDTADTEPPGGVERPVTAATGEDTDVVTALRGWAAAWSEKRADDYLARYAEGFRPADGSSRPAWEEARRARIERPQWIRVALTLVQVEPTGPDGAEVEFVQSYRSERYNDLVKKRMTMVREDGAWKIAAERSVP